jgi:hypothetical protein
LLSFFAGYPCIVHRRVRNRLLWGHRHQQPEKRSGDFSYSYSNLFLPYESTEVKMITITTMCSCMLIFLLGRILGPFLCVKKAGKQIFYTVSKKSLTNSLSVKVRPPLEIPESHPIQLGVVARLESFEMNSLNAFKCEPIWSSSCGTVKDNDFVAEISINSMRIMYLSRTVLVFEDRPMNYLRTDMHGWALLCRLKGTARTI